MGIPGHTHLSLHPIPELVKAPPPRLMLPGQSLQRSPSWGVPSQDPRTSSRGRGARTETRKVDSEIQTDARKSQRDRQEKPTGHRDNAELIELEKERDRRQKLTQRDYADGEGERRGGRDR